MAASEVPMWLPRDFANKVQAAPWSGKFCFIDATQRGDMYHIRAWQVLEQGKSNEAGAVGSTWHPPTIICNYVPKGESKSKEATVDYITEIIPKETWTFVTRWSWDELTDPDLQDHRHRPTKYDSDYPGDTSILVRSSMNSKKSIGPSECTDGIQVSSQTDRRGKLSSNQRKQFNIILQNMVKVDVKGNEALERQLDRSYETVFPNKETRNRKLAVILWRDTVASGGPYPELNTGAESAKQLVDTLDSLGLDACFIDVAKTALPPKVLEKAHCGRTPYFKEAVLESELWPESTARDREACWVKRAYKEGKEGWFDLVVGLRSGALDSMTFLGIPTVSIGLKDMIGETRMHKLGGDLFKRVNVDYAIPRHPGTKLVKPKRDGDLVFQSLAGQEAALHGFTPFDERTVKIGITFAAAQYVDDKELKKLKKPSLQFARLVTSQENRTYWDGVETDPPEPWNKSVKDLEEDDYRQPTEGTKESKERFEAEKRKMEDSWTKLRKKEDKKASDKAGKAGQPRTVGRGMRSIPEPEIRTTPVTSRAQRKAEKAPRKKNAPKGHRNCIAAGVRWLCCGIFRRR